jgi:hypothetical protein
VAYLAIENSPARNLITVSGNQPAQIARNDC